MIYLIKVKCYSIILVSEKWFRLCKGSNLFSLLLPFAIVAIPLLAFSGNLQMEAMTEKKEKSIFASSHPGLMFEENKGQVRGADAGDVKYVLNDGNVSMFLLSNGIAWQFTKIHFPEADYPVDDLGSKHTYDLRENLAKDMITETYRMDLILKGANQNSYISAEGKSTDYVQYYNHNALNVHSYKKITFHDIYPNIDWVVYTADETVKYDFVVFPGGDPDQIQLQVKWADDIKLNIDGSLTLSNIMGSITEKSPVSYQHRQHIPTRFKIDDNVITFILASYDKKETLVIDPTLQWATYYGGIMFESGNYCAVDSHGNVYLAGYTMSANNIAYGGHQNSFGGAFDAFLVKFNASGVRLWATYYGGTGDEFGEACAVDHDGNVFLAGRTASTQNIAYNGHQNNHGGSMWDAFLVKFDAGGVRQWATYYGGLLWDRTQSCAVDKNGNVYIAGSTESHNNISYNGHQNVYGGGFGDGFLVKFCPDGIRQWGTYYGGSHDEVGGYCAVDLNDNVYLAGATKSTENIAYHGHQNTFAGGWWDSFLVKFDASGVRQWATYYGGSETDATNAVAVDFAGNVFLSGVTNSLNNIAFEGHQNYYGGGWCDAYLVKFDETGKRLWATYYGGDHYDSGNAIVSDSDGNVFMAGETYSTNGIAHGGHQNTHADGGEHSDGYLVKFDQNGNRQWATYYGGIGNDGAKACAVDEAGYIYLAGGTVATENIAYNGHQNTNGGYSDAFLAKFQKNINSISEHSSSTFSIAPNPSNGLITVKFKSEATRTIKVFDRSGRIVFITKSKNSVQQIDLRNLPPGLYEMHVNEAGKQLSSKIIIL